MYRSVCTAPILRAHEPRLGAWVETLLRLNQINYEHSAGAVRVHTPHRVCRSEAPGFELHDRRELVAGTCSSSRRPIERSRVSEANRSTDFAIVTCNVFLTWFRHVVSRGHLPCRPQPSFTALRTWLSVEELRMVKLLLRGTEGRSSTSSNGVRDGSAAGDSSACALSPLARCANRPVLVGTASVCS